MVRMQGLSQHFLPRIHHQMREPAHGRDPMKGVAFLSKPMFFPFGFMMVATDREGERAGQRPKARVRSFSGFSITSVSRLRSLSWLLTHGTNWKQISLNALNSLRALDCQINKSSLRNPITAHPPQ